MMAAMAQPPAQDQRSSNPRTSNLDVEWLLHGKRVFHANNRNRSQPQTQQNSGLATIDQVTDSARTESPPPIATSPKRSSPSPPRTSPQRPQPVHTTSAPAVASVQPQTQYVGQKQHGSKPVAEGSPKGSKSSKKDGRRSSWFSSIGHKISGGNSASRSSSIDSTANKSPVQSPKVEFGNPFDKNAAKEQSKQQTEEPKVVVPQSPRRPSVLVAAGSETKLDNPGFLTSALRRLSSSNSVSMGKGAGTGAICPRKIMNVDQNRERVKIQDFDQNKLRRVAFRVDVEIAGVSAQADEEGPASSSALDPIGHPATSTLSKSRSPPEQREPDAAKYKEKGEGDALKNPETARQEKEAYGKTKVDAAAEAKQDRKDSLESNEGSPSRNGASPEKPLTKKKEKKKRSEAERKERKARKRRHAEANGLVPLELYREDYEDSSSSSGTSTPRNGDKPTTDPLRIYKRCCQLRETTALSLIKEQISKPAASLTEAPGTVGVLDLSGSRIPLQDIVTFGDWLAVVPVRKLVLDDCALTDEALRVVLSGLLGCKTVEQARANRKLPRRGSGKSGQEQMGVVEKISLKNNTGITSIGWKHIALFIHMSRTLTAIDLTGIPYPKSSGDLSRESTANGLTVPSTKSQSCNGSLVARAIEQKVGDKLEELVLSGCAMSTANVSEIVDAAINSKIRRMGLAGNNLNGESLAHVVRFVTSGSCEGLDLGSNDLHSYGRVLAEALNDQNPIFALSLADCNITSDDLNKLLPKISELKNFKFIDLSRNRELFKGAVNTISTMRRCLPKMTALKRLHLADVDMTPEHLMALTDILPDCASLAHINILENADLVRTMNSTDVKSQEEAAAFLTALMTAVRISQTLMAIELEVPSAEASEVVRALSSQVLAYSLRNMERMTSSEASGGSKTMTDHNAFEILLHIVGHMEGYPNEFDNESPAPDEDYLIASTGVVRALSVCLDRNGSHNNSRQITPTGSGTATPRQGVLRPQAQRKKPKDVSRQLCDSAKKIRTRLQPALAKDAGHGEEYHRVRMLDQTLQRIIQRFEEEYPEPPSTSKDVLSSADVSPVDSPVISRVSSLQDGSARGRDTNKIDHASSTTTAAAKELTHEEGRMLRFGQVMRREIFRPVGTDDFAHGTSIHDDPEPAHLEALRGKLAGWSGDQIRQKVDQDGADRVVDELKINMEELKMMEKADPVGFEALRHSALMAEIKNASNGSQNGESSSDNGSKTTIPGSFNAQVTS